MPQSLDRIGRNALAQRGQEFLLTVLAASAGASSPLPIPFLRACVSIRLLAERWHVEPAQGAALLEVNDNERRPASVDDRRALAVVVAVADALAAADHLEVARPDRAEVRAAHQAGGAGGRRDVDVAAVGEVHAV